jgi:hypothetical protein
MRLDRGGWRLRQCHCAQVFILKGGLFRRSYNVNAPKLGTIPPFTHVIFRA